MKRLLLNILLISACLIARADTLCIPKAHNQIIQNEINNRLKQDSIAETYPDRFVNDSDEYIYVIKNEDTTFVENRWRRPFGYRSQRFAIKNGEAINYRNGREIDLMLQQQGWEWANSPLLDQVQRFYPQRIEYSYSPRHEGIRICDYIAFDDNGKLLRVLRLDIDDDAESDFKKDYFKRCAVKDYKENKYNIKAAKNSVINALEILLGLRARGNKKWAPIPGMKEAKNFVLQSNADHMGEVDDIWKVERIDDINFKVSFINRPHDKLVQYIVKFVADGPYKVKTHVKYIGTQDFDPTPWL